MDEDDTDKLFYRSVTGVNMSLTGAQETPLPAVLEKTQTKASGTKKPTTAAKKEEDEEKLRKEYVMKKKQKEKERLEKQKKQDKELKKIFGTLEEYEKKVKEVQEEEKPESSFAIEEKTAGKVEKQKKFEAMIIDLGIGKDLHKLSSSIGFTPWQAAPEIIGFAELHKNDVSNAEDLKKGLENQTIGVFTPKADIYSFGVILFKIFIKEIGDIDTSAINKDRIKKRISEVFQHDKEIIPNVFLKISKIFC